MKKVCKLWEFRLFCLLISVICITAIPEAVHGADEGQVVRVGCMNVEDFLKIDGIDSAKGYGADYLNKISEYTGWKYKYVTGSWSQCLTWLKEGRIDLLMPAEYSKERAESFLFSKEICYLSYAILIGRKDDDSLYYKDSNALNGINIGLIRENHLNSLFETYAKEKGFQAKRLYFASEHKMNDALEKGEIDAFVSGSMNFTENQKILDKMGYEPAYFIMPKGQEALMEQLNDALYNITLDYPSFSSDLYKKYYSKIERQTVSFTREEYEYIKNARPIKVLYEVNDSPLEYQDEKTQQGKGVYVDILQMIFDECGLKYELIPNTGGKSSWLQVAHGDADILLSAYNIASNRQKFDLDFSDSYYTASYSLVGRQGNDLNLENRIKIAVIEMNEGEKALIRNQYPNWEMIGCSSLADCLAMVKSGQADIAFANSTSLQILQGSAATNHMVTFTTDEITIPISIGFHADTDPKLKSIINKGVKKLDNEKIQQSVFNQILEVKPDISLSYFLSNYPVESILFIIAIFFILAYFTFSCLQSLASKNQNKILQAKNLELEKAIAAQHRLQQENEQDPLTGLKNKKTARQLSTNLLKQLGDSKCALFVIDIDNFKHVNDTYGHLTGDETIKLVAEQLKKAFDGHVVGRIGGDEFMVMMSPVNAICDINSRTECFYQYLAAAKIGDSQASVTCSIGIALSRAGGNSYKEMFARADQALYTAKRNGKNRYAVEE